uniref:Uncharacterized protein n=1 Tax=Romanomermis culicivorax TaxID=13658 RepID=A0A915KWB1_ROMCU
MSTGEKYVQVDQINENDMQSKRLLNPQKYYGLLTENQMKLFEHVINYHKNQLWKFLDRTRMIQKLRNIYMISNAVTLGIIYKNIVADLYRGDYAGAMSGAAFLGGNYLISEGFTFLAERKYLQNSKTLGFMSPVLKRSAPFLRRFAAGYNLYSLYKSSLSYSKNGDTTSLVNIIESSTFLAVDVAEISMELAGAEALLLFFGPVGAAVAALVFIGADIYQVHEKLKPYDEVLHLSMADKVSDGVYTFFTGEVDSAMRDMANEKQINEYLAISASEYMSNHTDKQKMSHGTEILCFTSSETEWSDHSKDATLFEKFKYLWNSFLKSITDNLKKKETSYRCDNALGLSNGKVKNGKIVIDLQNGDDTVNGFNKNEHVFIIGDGKKTIRSRSDELSTFLFVGNLTTGSIFSSSNGTGIADFTNYAHNLTQPLVIKTYNRKTIIYSYNNSQLSLDNVFNILGRKDKPDHVSASCFMKVFNGNGAGKNYFDILTIPDLLCFYNLTILAGDSTKIVNQASVGFFKYSLTLDVGSALINTTNSSLAEHEIFFVNWNMLELDRLFFENGCIFFVYWTAYCRICNGYVDTFTFRFLDGFSLKINGNRTVHAFGTITNSSDSQISVFRSVSQRLGIIFNMRSLDTNSSIMMNHESKTQKNKYVPVALPSDPNNKRSLLIGGAVENIFLVNPTINFSVIETTISILHEHSLHNTIDLTSFARRSFSYTVEKIADDLILIIHSATNQSESKSHGIKVSLRIKNSFINELYKTFSIILNSPMLIVMATNDSVYLKPRPLIIDPLENPAMIIRKNQIEPSLEIQVIQEVLAWNIYCANENLIWFANGGSVDFFWIILQDFYTIDDQSLIDIRIKFDHNGVESDKLELSWNNTRPEKVQNLESIMEIFASNMK